MPRPVIDYSKCKTCSTCTEVCPTEVFAKDGDKVLVKNPKECISCKACESQCPEEAIIVED